MYITDMESKQKEKGLVIVYTGEGKGKTTAALGLALRAVGYKKKVLIIQFGKSWFSGEVEGVKKLGSSVKLIQGGKGFVKIMGDKLPLEEHKKAAQESLEKLLQEVVSNKWDLVIADELVGAVAGGLLDVDQVLDLITRKPLELDLVLTGHHAHPKIVEQADLVTEMVSIKHPFEKGIIAKKGIDF